MNIEFQIKGATIARHQLSALPPVGYAVTLRTQNAVPGIEADTVLTFTVGNDTPPRVDLTTDTAYLDVEGFEIHAPDPA